MDRIMSEDADFLSNKFKNLDLEGARILVTGSSGLIGRNLIQFLYSLLESNDMKFDVDAYSNYPNLDSRACHPRIQRKFGNLISKHFSLENNKYDYVFHAATYGQPAKFVKNSIETMMLNGPVVMSLSEHLEIGGTFVFFSSSEVYSGSPKIPHVESDFGRLGIDESRAPYVYGKLFGETTLMQLREKYKVRIPRISLAYGPGTKEGDSRVLNQLIQRGITEGRVDLKDSGNAIRTYCYVRDVIEMMITMTFFGQHEVYNVGGNSSISIRKLGELISTILDVPFSLQGESPAFLIAPTEVQVSMAKYESEFQAIDYLDLSEGLHKTIEWQKTYLYSGEKS